LWKSDGTAAGTVRVKDINPGSDSSSPRSLTNVSGTLYFIANDGTTGRELWKSDGTEAGTVLVKEILPGTSQSSYPSGLMNVGGTLYFVANDGSSPGLWKSDGTTAGTQLVKHIGIASSLTNASGTLYFAAGDGASGFELWKSDGTDAGTVLVKDINPGLPSSAISNVTNVGGTLYFQANDGTTGVELWKSDGTDGGTVLVKDIRPGSSNAFTPNSSSFTNVDGTLYFVANDGTSGNELWKSDGTVAGTVRVKDIRNGSSGSFPSYSVLKLSNVGGTLYFVANNGPNGYELWKSDGTAAGTVLVKDFTGDATSSNPSNITEANGRVYVVATSPQCGREIWVADLTPKPVGDYSRNGLVDAADYVLWRNTLGSTTDLQANGDNTGASAGVIDQADYTVWRNNFGNATPAAVSAALSSATSVESRTPSALSAPVVDVAVSAVSRQSRSFRPSSMTAHTPSRATTSTASRHTTVVATVNEAALLLVIGQELPRTSWISADEQDACDVASSSLDPPSLDADEVSDQVITSAQFVVF
jgi:ELWxxDGT repeat protein